MLDFCNLDQMESTASYQAALSCRHTTKIKETFTKLDALKKEKKKKQTRDYKILFLLIIYMYIKLWAAEGINHGLGDYISDGSKGSHHCKDHGAEEHHNQQLRGEDEGDGQLSEENTLKQHCVAHYCSYQQSQEGWCKHQYKRFIHVNLFQSKRVELRREMKDTLYMAGLLMPMARNIPISFVCSWISWVINCCFSKDM